MQTILVDQEIVLRKIRTKDAEEVFETICQNRQFLRQWLPFVDQTQTKADTENYIRMLLEEKDQPRNEVFTIWYFHEFAGLAGFKDIDPINHKTEIGYWLAENMQGRGIMTRTVRKMTGYGFQAMNMNRIQIKVAIGNTRSSAIPKRLGYGFEGVERSGEFHTDRYFDLEVYSMLKNEWD